MDIKYVFVLIIGLINIILGIFILIKNPQNKSNFWYFWLCFTGGGWAVAKYFQLTIPDIYLQYSFLTKLMYILAIFAPYAYLMLAYHFPYQLKTYSKKILIIIFFIPIIIAAFVANGSLTPHFSYIVDNSLSRVVNLSHFIFFFIYFYFYISLGFILILVKLTKASGIYKKQIIYLTIATLGTFFTTGIFSMILPLFNSFTYDWFGAILLIFHFIVAGYLIFYKPSKV